ncbi:MAG: PhnB protein [Oceanotoga sp.]|uniref:VOC family protein n=1 Tax=Oceanotoga sp. TaxID=2108366 RepID=UPI00264CC500|nr:hypothetical protein [Oceanotoga sp.]MDN5343669.1 PhnB protein [Oceanotoga sp.]
MKITLQAYLKNSVEAVNLYIKAFDAELGYNVKNEDGTFLHAEIIKDQKHIISISESNDWNKSGENMQFCLNFGKENKDKLMRAYEILKIDGNIIFPLGPCDWNEMMADLIDKFGIRWYIAL